MTTYYNSTQATLRKIKDEFLHAMLLSRTLTEYPLETEEETKIELGHYPSYYHYTGGSKDGTDEPYSTSADVRNYLFHAADGKWYGLVRRDNRKYSYSSGSREYYDHVIYEWFMDTIDGNKCTTQKIVAPSDISEFTSIGMSGKWLMCYTGSKVYRIDTTNVANIELVPDMLYIRDDDLKLAFTTMINKLVYCHKLVLKPYLKALQENSGDTSLLNIQQLEILLEQNTEQRETLHKLMGQDYIDQILYTQENNALLSQAGEYRNQIELLNRSQSLEATKVYETERLLHFCERGVMQLEYSEELFELFVDHIEVYSRQKIGFALHCGLILKEMILLDTHPSVTGSRMARQ